MDEFNDLNYVDEIELDDLPKTISYNPEKSRNYRRHYSGSDEDDDDEDLDFEGYYDFSEVNTLVHADLSNKNLKQSNFRNKNCSNANFSGAILDSSDFRGANLTNANFTNASMRNVIFDDADFTDAQLEDADLTQLPDTYKLENATNIADFTRANMYGANLTGRVGIELSDFSDATLTNIVPEELLDILRPMDYVMKGGKMKRRMTKRIRCKRKRVKRTKTNKRKRSIRKKNDLKLS